LVYVDALGRFITWNQISQRETQAKACVIPMPAKASAQQFTTFSEALMSIIMDMTAVPEAYLHKASDEELVDSVLAGNLRDFDLLIERWQKPLYNFTLRFMSSEEEARDACQDTFVNAYRNLSKFKKESKFSSWLFKIAINRCNTLLRKRKRWRMFFDPVPDAAQFADTVLEEKNIEQTAEREQIFRRMRRAISQLPEEQKTVLLLKEYEGMKFHEISEMLDCPLSTVKSRMYYALDGLRKALKLVEVKNR
jgi:RNA polymerase sigma-70 factor (ECF subfamily)